jgi:hypothetical protein
MGAVVGGGNVVVQSSGQSPEGRDGHLASLLFLPVFVLTLVYATNGGPSQNLALKLTLAAAAFVIMDTLIHEAAAYPRKVILSPDELQFVYWIHTERGSWQDIEGQVKEVRGRNQGEWIVARKRPRSDIGPLVRGHRVCEAQARAIMDYPSGRQWTVS